MVWEGIHVEKGESPRGINSLDFLKEMLGVQIPRAGKGTF
jgi:hypothetical protein